MRIKIVLLPVLFALFLFFLSPSLAPCFSKGYSADVITYINHKEQMTGKVYVSGEKIRMEAQMKMAQAITITRLDKRVVWILMPKQKIYMETALRPRDMAAAKKVPGEMTRQYLGEENVEGRPAKKYRITFKYENKTSSVYSWIDDSMDVPIKISDVKGEWTVVYKNLKQASPPADLFEIPAGYKKMPVSGIQLPSGINIPKLGK